MSEDGPHVLILGGLGMIGRNLLKYLIDYKLASFIRVVDKSVPTMAFLGAPFDSYYTSTDPDYTTHFEFIQGDLAVATTVEAAFAPPTHRPYPFTIVINLAAETQYGFMDAKYERTIYQLRVQCAKKAFETGAVDRYIEVGTAQVYDCSNSKPVKEEDATTTGSKTKLKPWTLLAKHHLAAEQAIAQQFPQLNYIILRLPIVYGPGDLRGLMPRIAAAAVYEYSGLQMKFLWGEELRMHTVHVQDVAAGIWHLVCAGELHQVYNLVDDNDTSQGSFNTLLESLFNIRTGFHGSIMSNLAKLKLEELVEEANDDHMEPWEALLKEKHISLETPVNPYLEKELLYNNPCCIDGSKMKALGFQCSCPQVTKELLEDSIQYWKDQKLFP